MTQTIPIDGMLKQRILNRLGREAGRVEIQEEEEWDLGFCDTCSYPETGFAVYVDGELEWPRAESLEAQGGRAYGDSCGHIDPSSGELVLSDYALFDAWLRNLDLNEYLEGLE